MISDKQKQRIEMLRSRGYGYRKVADKLGLNLNSVKSYCKRNGLGGVAKPVKTAARKSGRLQSRKGSASAATSAGTNGGTTTRN